jgi:hypothetical protein
MKPLKDRCLDSVFRLCVYEAGHTITAYLLRQKIVSVCMLPRPPMTITEKAFNSSWGSFIEILENRALELFGGQIAEEIICGSTSCCSGDISRIDEITRILEALYSEDVLDAEDILFELEDRAKALFMPANVQNAILPIADFLYEQEENGVMEIDGDIITAAIAEHIPPVPKEKPSLLERLHLA